MAKAKSMIVEIRSTGVQTVIPPSIHLSKELIRSNNGIFEPSEVDPVELRRAVSKLAAACLLLRHWPPEGSRNDMVLALSGALARSDMSQEEIEDFVGIVAKESGDEEWESRVRIVQDSIRKLEDDSPVQGLPRLEDHLGKNVTDLLAKWLGLRKPKTDSASNAAIEAAIDEINKEYAFVLVGGKGVILREIKDEN